MIEELLKAGGEKLLTPIIVVVVGTAVARGLFGLHRSRSSTRRDFLELWSKVCDRDDVWLEVAVRHLFGVYLPAQVIRSLLGSVNPGRALLEISEAWPLLVMSQDGQLMWKAMRHRAPAVRRVERLILLSAYFVLAASGLWLAYEILTSPWSPYRTVIAWFYVGLLLLTAFVALSRAEILAKANDSVPRWLNVA